MKHLVTKGKHTRTEEDWEKRRQASKEHYFKHPEYYKNWIKENIESKLCTNASMRAKKRGIEFSISKKDIVLPEYCPILGLKLEMNVGTGAGGKGNSYSLDRIDPTKGYIPGNIQVISHKANSMKLNASKEELLLFAEWIKRTYD